MRHFESAGTWALAFTGALVGAKVVHSVGWVLGPMYPLAIAGGALFGGVAGCISGKNLGQACDIKFSDKGMSN